MGTTQQLQKINVKIAQLQREAARLVESRDPELCSKIVGQEAAKRAITVAAVQKQPVVFVGPDGVGKHKLVAIAAQLEVPAVAWACCPCGNLTNMGAACRCTSSQLKRHTAKLQAVGKDFEIHVEVSCPGARTQLQAAKPEWAGLSLAQIQKHLSHAGPLPAATLENVDEGGRALLRHAIQELGLTPDAVAVILKTAASIQALEGYAEVREISTVAIAEAIQYRRLDRRI